VTARAAPGDRRSPERIACAGGRFDRHAPRPGLVRKAVDRLLTMAKGGVLSQRRSRSAISS